MPSVRDLLMRLFGVRWLVRAPIALYGHGLGWVLGRRFVLVEHTGRRSGLTRSVVLEVVDRPDPDSIVVCAGFGPSSQWYRNVRATPEVHVSSGHDRHVPAVARVLSRAQAEVSVGRYATRHPFAWRSFAWLLAPDGGTVADLPFVAFTEPTAGTGPPTESDDGVPRP